MRGAKNVVHKRYMNHSTSRNTNTDYIYPVWHPIPAYAGMTRVLKVQKKIPFYGDFLLIR